MSTVSALGGVITYPTCWSFYFQTSIKSPKWLWEATWILMGIKGPLFLWRIFICCRHFIIGFNIYGTSRNSSHLFVVVSGQRSHSLLHNVHYLYSWKQDEKDETQNGHLPRVMLLLIGEARIYIRICLLLILFLSHFLTIRVRGKSRVGVLCLYSVSTLASLGWNCPAHCGISGSTPVRYPPGASSKQHHRCPWPYS